MGLLLHALHAHQPLPDHSAALAHYEHQAALAKNMARFSGSPVEQACPAWAYEAAEEALLADVDTYTDWLGGECYRKTAKLPVLPSDKGALQIVVDGSDVPRLVAMLLYPAADVRDLAAAELRQRYIAAHVGYINRMADRLAWGEA